MVLVFRVGDPLVFCGGPPVIRKDPPGFLYDPPGFRKDPPGFPWDPLGFLRDPPCFSLDPPGLVGDRPVVVVREVLLHFCNHGDIASSTIKCPGDAEE
ncbi:hypothetical protein LIER_06627 [Lithospermum erythrorhizon]|uniref:Uncharacterized protein n=1 Tax=Lithospermum erythrorhizon TaxID=34254 RepID=A0AAV3P5W3_LITER